MELKNKAIVITGAGRGIGAACARAAAELGAAVIVNDIDAEPAAGVVADIRAKGGTAFDYVADVAKFAQAEALISRCIKEFGRIDGLVNNAGVFGMGRVDEITPEQLEYMFSVNVIGTANCAHHAAKHMIAAKSGSIVNVSSGAQMGIGATGVYGATKGAVASFTYAWALDLMPHGVRVNAVSPLAATRMGDITLQYLTEHGLPPYPGTQPPPEANTPMVCFLLSDRSLGVSGQVIRLEGKYLSLISHPGICMPPIERTEWNCVAVADAFDRELRDRQLPVGIAGLEVRTAGTGSAYWATPAPKSK